MAIVIKKRVTFEFLGDAYNGAYIDFRSLPLADYDTVMADFPTSEEDAAKNKDANKIILKYLKEYFVGGKFPNDDGKLEDITSDDLDGLDAESALASFKIWSGQGQSPKAETPSTSPSETTPTT